MLLIIDNYDSFTYNLVQYFGELGAKPLVKRNDEIAVPEIEKLRPRAIVISPGPCTPKEAGISNKVIAQLGPRLPLLGVCLGHQCIGDVYGAKVVRAARLMHGKTSPILHDGTGLFEKLPDAFEATRYHSLLVDPPSVPDALLVNATTAEGEIMGLRHRDFPSMACSSIQNRFSHATGRSCSQISCVWRMNFISGSLPTKFKYEMSLLAA